MLIKYAIHNSGLKETEIVDYICYFRKYMNTGNNFLPEPDTSRKNFIKSVHMSYFTYLNKY